MPPTREEFNQLQKLLYEHQHSAADLTSKLRNQDWQQIGKSVLSGVAASIRVDIPQKQFLKILISAGAKSGASDDYLRFNNVSTGTPYTFINSGGTARTSQNQIDLRDGLNSALGFFAVIDVINNLSTLEKSISAQVVNRIAAAGTAQSLYQIFGTWVNTDAFISRIDLVSSGAATYPANSQILVLSSRE